MEFLTQIADDISISTNADLLLQMAPPCAKIKLWNGNVITLTSVKSVNIVSQQVS